jgi:hypothetical protein
MIFVSIGVNMDISVLKYFIFCLSIILVINMNVNASDFDYSKTIQKIAEDIYKLKADYPQLKDFSPDKDVEIENLAISYEYKTHQSTRSAGWVAAVPNPDEDGIWFYIDFHDPKSTRQIHTQPVIIPAYIGDKKVSFLILEGKKTKSIEGLIWQILEKNGVKTTVP